MDDYATCPQPHVLMYETRYLTDTYAVDTLNFWQGGMVGYLGAILTVVAFFAILNRMRPQGGARP